MAQPTTIKPILDVVWSPADREGNVVSQQVANEDPQRYRCRVPLFEYTKDADKRRFSICSGNCITVYRNAMKDGAFISRDALMYITDTLQARFEDNGELANDN